MKAAQLNTDSRMVGLDFLRFLAASIVICNHANMFGQAGVLFEKSPAIVGRITGMGWVAVDIFFVLSGFLVSGLLFKEFARTGTISISRFLIRRGFKIYPPLWVMIVTTIAWVWLKGGTIPLRSLCGELFYLQNYGLQMWGHTWSLAVEEHFYFLLAGIFIVQKWRTKPGLAFDFHWIPNLFLTVAVLCLVLRAVTWAVILTPTNFNMFWFNRADHALMDSLFFGVLLSHLWHNYWDDQIKMKVFAWRGPLALIGAFLVSPIISDVIDLQWFRIFGFILIYLGAGCLLLSSLSLDYFPCPAFVRWLASLGKYSYSVYLWHIPVGYGLTPLLREKWQGNSLAWSSMH
ncbi:MAG: acyltransferase [Limisphaerales bacterium]